LFVLTQEYFYCGKKKVLVIARKKTSCDKEKQMSIFQEKNSWHNESILREIGYSLGALGWATLSMQKLGYLAQGRLPSVGKSYVLGFFR